MAQKIKRIESNLFAGTTWAVTGAAGFIGSNIVEYLLLRGAKVIGVDNLSTGTMLNIYNAVGQKPGFDFIHDDIRNPDVCRYLVSKASYVLHQAAIASVPASIEDPFETNAVNVGGTINIFKASATYEKSVVRKVVYASSCAVYGDNNCSPVKENYTGTCLSPYALSKRDDELYAVLFNSLFGLNSIGLRYFNIYGPRQNPNSDYSAVIPKWICSFLNNASMYIYGDGSQTRDFCYVEDCVLANISAALNNRRKGAFVYNVGTGKETTLIDLFNKMRIILDERRFPIFKDARLGDILSSCADISLIEKKLSFKPLYGLMDGLKLTIDWYKNNQRGD